MTCCEIRYRKLLAFSETDYIRISRNCRYCCLADPRAADRKTFNVFDDQLSGVFVITVFQVPVIILALCFLGIIRCRAQIESTF